MWRVPGGDSPELSGDPAIPFGKGHGQFARRNRLAMSFPQAFFKASLILELVVACWIETSLSQ
ncbi:hypothetical protein EJB05_36083, partial [Eragrostis curvula]